MTLILPTLRETKVTVKSKRLEADGRNLLFEVSILGEDKMTGEGLPRRTLRKGTG